MFENYTYKKKLIGLCILLVLLLLAANKKSFRVAKQAFGQLQEVKEQLEFMKTSSIGSKELQQQLSYYDRLIGKQNVEPEAAKQSILDFATKYNNVKINELKETHFSHANGYDVITNQLILEGSYASLSEILYDFEKKFDTSSLVSFAYYKEKNYKKRTSELKVHLIFQNYEKSL
ncbi:MAG: hypothetical protein GYB37_14485 [Algicola sp.]|nr:hypothetical protein [Algicola sp.]